MKIYRSGSSQQGLKLSIYYGISRVSKRTLVDSLVANMTYIWFSSKLPHPLFSVSTKFPIFISHLICVGFDHVTWVKIFPPPQKQPLMKIQQSRMQSGGLPCLKRMTLVIITLYFLSLTAKLGRAIEKATSITAQWPGLGQA